MIKLQQVTASSGLLGGVQGPVTGMLLGGTTPDDNNASQHPESSSIKKSWAGPAGKGQGQRHTGISLVDRKMKESGSGHLISVDVQARGLPQEASQPQAPSGQQQPQSVEAQPGRPRPANWSTAVQATPSGSRPSYANMVTVGWRASNPDAAHASARPQTASDGEGQAVKQDRGPARDSSSEPALSDGVRSPQALVDVTMPRTPNLSQEKLSRDGVASTPASPSPSLDLPAQGEAVPRQAGGYQESPVRPAHNPPRKVKAPSMKMGEHALGPELFKTLP